MRSGGGAHKGAAAERKIARMLSCWWYNGDANFLWRRPGSGFRARMPHRHTGDIVPIADVELPHFWPWHVQVKNWSRDRVKLDTLFTCDSCHPIVSVWTKEDEERRRDLRLMLLVKIDRVGLLCFMRRADVEMDLTVISHICLCIDGDEVIGLDWYLLAKFGGFPWRDDTI